MKKRLLDVLVCPVCRRSLDLKITQADETEIIEGELGCPSCSRSYAIRAGIPRFVDDRTYAESFGFEWNRFRKVQLDSVNGTNESEVNFARVTGWSPSDLRGRLVLDAGVGAGRYTDIVSRWGGEVVGVDLTRAVDAAFENVGRREGVHLVQADIFALPFRPGSFDAGYSIGVLHHTPAAHEAFGHVAAQVRPGGQCAVYVYHAGGMARYFSDAIRRLTTRLPLRVVYGLSIIAGPLYYVHRLPVIGRLLQALLPISLEPRWRWRWLDTFDWYSPRYQSKHRYPEIFGWFRQAGFTVVHVASQPICMRGVKHETR